MKNNIDVIFWDFDGVLMDSNSIRDEGFIKVLKDFPHEEVEQLLRFHRKNGGLSRYVKFRFFFEEIRKEKISDEEVAKWAKQFSLIMRELLVDPQLLISKTLNFVRKNYRDFSMYIVSGSDGEELNYLSNRLNISNYFIDIKGSPTPKKELIREIISKNNYKPSSCLLVGDSVNDWDAASHNGINFMGYNCDPGLKAKGNFELKLA